LAKIHTQWPIFQLETRSLSGVFKHLVDLSLSNNHLASLTNSTFNELNLLLELYLDDNILAQGRVIIVDPVIYAWTVAFILPINSAVNPFLYTLMEIISNYRDKKRKGKK